MGNDKCSEGKNLRKGGELAAQKKKEGSKT